MNQNYQTPEWTKKAIWYQIFPDRFRNGDMGNDYHLTDLHGAWPHDLREPWHIHPWGSDWYELQPYEKVNGKDIWYNIQRRRFGGDLQGIIDKLDYLQQLGINAIYLNPVFQAPSSHKYDGATYHHIDPNLGPDPEDDRKLMRQETPHDPKTWIWTSADRLMLSLISEIHKRDMHVIFDGVFNHVGLEHWAFKDVVQFQQQSKYKDWFTIFSWDDPRKKTELTYRCWWNIKELPEWRQDDSGIVKGPKEYIFAATKRWMNPFNEKNPSNGIDGWRLDVAYCIKHPFWKDWRKWVLSLNSQAYLTAEVIGPNERLSPFLLGDEFDAVMNYNFAFLCADYFFARTLSTQEFDRQLRELRLAFHPDMVFGMQNLFDSHDTDRLASHIVNSGKMPYRNWSEYHQWSKANNPEYDTRKPNAHEIAMQKLFVIFQMTYIGAPMIYYGDEVGMWGANDPCCRKPMLWDDIAFENEKFRPNGIRHLQPQKNQINPDLLTHYQKLIKIRRTLSCLQLGEFETIPLDPLGNLYAFVRKLGTDQVLVILNNSQNEQRIRLWEWFDELRYDVLNNQAFEKEPMDAALNIEPFWARILASKTHKDLLIS